MIKKELAEKDKKRYEFFEKLLEQLRDKTGMFSNVSPVGYQSWVCAGAGKSGMLWQITATQRASRVELCFNAPSSELNRRRFEAMLECKDKIEREFGEPLRWDYKEDRKHQHIHSDCFIGGYDDRDKWQAVHSDLVNRIVRLECSLRDAVKRAE